MPRPRVSEAARRRIAKACLHCQSTKQKCDGNSPCNSCIRRERSGQCAYSDHVRSYGQHRRRRKALQREYNPVKDTKPPDTATSTTVRDGFIEIAVPRSRSLYDTRGKVVYLGDCSALSFLQNIQELIEREIQPSTGSNRGEFEELPPDPDERGLPYAGNVHDLNQLIQIFFTATCGVLDIIEYADVARLLQQWIGGSLDQHRAGEAVLYLILAYAAQAQASCALSHKRAHSFYHHGRRIALLHLTDDPSIETVQAFLLISLYMLGCSRRNGSYLNLGIAISAAKALGFHREETNRSFPQRESRLRARIWTTLKYHDLHFCAMMGRTSATITTDCTVSAKQDRTTDFTREADQEIALRESALAFSFMERTVNEIYTKRTVSMGALKNMARELQEAIHQIPPDIQTIPSPTLTDTTTTQKVLLRNANVLCSYYFSMMLLTRPFLVAKLRAYLNTAPSLETENALIYTDITENASSCIEAATKTVQILHRLLTTKALLRNMPLTVAWTFVSALTICSAYFGQLGTTSSNEESIIQAGQILDHFAASSPQARRYSRILSRLSGAAMKHSKEHNPSGEFRFDSCPASFATDNNGEYIPPQRELQATSTHEGLGTASEEINFTSDDTWNLNVDMSLFPLDLGNADSIWDINWVGSLM